jgi:hypothetical protein
MKTLNVFAFASLTVVFAGAQDPRLAFEVASIKASAALSQGDERMSTERSAAVSSTEAFGELNDVRIRD